MTTAMDDKPSQCDQRVEKDEFVLFYKLHENGLSIQFWCIEHLCADDGGPMIFQRAGSDYSPDIVEAIDDAEWLIAGSVKWDGCADFDIGDERSQAHRLHACGKKSAMRIARAIEFVYDTAAKAIVGWDGDS